VRELQHLTRDVGSQQIWAALDADGGVIVDAFVPEALLAQIRSEIQPVIAAHPSGSQDDRSFWRDFHGVATKRITGLASFSKGWVELLCDPLYQELGDRYLGADDYYLNTGQLICIGPGETPQLLHRDEQNWPAAAGREEELTITAIFALTDFTEDNGATVVVPGSHRWPVERDVQPEERGRATMQAGSALLYSGKILHGGGANVSRDRWRIGLHAGFVRGWLRAEENHQLTTSLEVARTLPERAQKLLGFRSYEQPMGGRLGLVDYDDAARLL